MKTVQLEIFGKVVFGNDAIEWFDSSFDFKKDWIKKNTNQQNETLIDEFLKNLKKPCNCGCLNCGKNDISKENAIEVIEPIEIVSTSGYGKRGINKRRKNDINP